MKLIAGVDEVGRGPLAGPVMACAYIARVLRRLKIIYEIHPSKFTH